ncbi:MAG: hypothetical protein QGG05_19455, partial [Candidatus Latescibacteria bacterium]|nr:hypothetical protein [Candidatus Latescibacterota bacterium]
LWEPPIAVYWSNGSCTSNLKWPEAQRTRTKQKAEQLQAQLDGGLKQTLLKYGLPSSLITFPLFLNSRVDQVIMIAMVPRSELGIYVAGVSFSLVALIPFQALAKITAPRIAAAGQEWRLISVRLILASVAIAAVTMLIALPLTSWAFPTVMGNQFRTGVAAAQLLIAASTLRGCADVFQECIRGLGLPGRAVFVEIAGLVVGLATLFLLIDKHGVIGAAIASNLGYGTALVGQALLLIVAFRRHDDRGRDTGGNSAGPANQ